MDITTLSILFCNSQKKEIQKSNISGSCIFCSRETAEGWKVDKTVSNNFTAWSNLSDGQCACEYCYTMLKDPNCRRRSWAINPTEYIAIDKTNRKQILFNPPEPPFFIHLATSGQKQTWMGSFNKINYSKNKYIFTIESHGEVFWDIAIAKDYDKLILAGLEKKLTKTELTQVFKLKTYENAIKDNFLDLLKQIESCRRNRLWEVLVYAN